MLILALDLETTGLDVEKDYIIEMAVALWDTRSNRILAQIASLIHDGAKTISPEIAAITGITQEIYDSVPQHLRMDMDEFFDGPLPHFDAMMAHNGTNFDRPFLTNALKKYDIEPDPSVHWIDTAVDIPYPAHIHTRKLTHLAADHGIYVPSAHEAMADVHTMIKIASQYDMEKVLARSKEKNVTLVACVDFHNKDLAKETGFRWDGNGRKWLKTVKESELEAACSEKRFLVTVLEAQTAIL